jgi:hypothetical protein
VVVDEGEDADALKGADADALKGADAVIGNVAGISKKYLDMHMK